MNIVDKDRKYHVVKFRSFGLHSHSTQAISIRYIPRHLLFITAITQSSIDIESDPRRGTIRDLYGKRESCLTLVNIAVKGSSNISFKRYLISDKV